MHKFDDTDESTLIFWRHFEDRILPLGWPKELWWIMIDEITITPGGPPLAHCPSLCKDATALWAGSLLVKGTPIATRATNDGVSLKTISTWISADLSCWSLSESDRKCDGLVSDKNTIFKRLVHDVMFRAEPRLFHRCVSSTKTSFLSWPSQGLSGGEKWSCSGFWFFISFCLVFACFLSVELHLMQQLRQHRGLGVAEASLSFICLPEA